MLPVGEINLVVGGIATFAASVGYVFTRRLRADPRSTEDNGPDQSDSTTNTQMDPKNASGSDVSVTYEEPATLGVSDPKIIAMESEPIESSAPIPPPSRRSSLALKRKRSFDDDDDDPPADAGYPHNLATIYPPPKKRSRTPSTDEKTNLDVSEAGVSSIVDQGAAKEVEEPSTDLVGDDTAAEKSPSVATPEPDSSNGVPLPSPPHTPKHSPRKVNEPLPVPSAPASGALFGTLPSTGTPRTPLPSRAATMNAFSAFSGTASPFASFRAASPSRSNKPVWTSQENVVSGPTAVAPNEVSVSDEENATSAPRRPKSGHALEAVLASKSTVEYLTGEENEDVELELKGVKLYIKRGDKPFADGVVGHIKLLSNKTTLDERLLFRREPLWKVSMNVRIHSSVRCTYEAEENILRLILHEYIELPNVPQEDWKKEIVVYALKPSRSCSKQDFNDFATSLVECPGLKPR